MTQRLKDAFSFCAAVAIGLAVSTGSPAGLVAATGMPVVCLLPRTRTAAFENAIGYYTAGLSPMIPGLQRYIGPSAGPLSPFAIWLLAAALLSVPWVVAWTEHRTQYLWRTPLALLAACIPPLGIIGFISPLTGAGYMFPSGSWAGLAAVVLVPGMILSAIGSRSRWRLAMASVALAVCGALAIDGRIRVAVSVPVPPAWVAINTNFGDLSQPFRDFTAATFIQQKAAESADRVMIFPEFIVPRWSEATETFWRRTLDLCRLRGQTLLMGAGLPSSKPLNGAFPVFDFAPSIASIEHDDSSAGVFRERVSPEAIDNALIAVGANSGVVYQRVPVPIGMWRPFSKANVPLRLSTPGVIGVDHQRVAVLICYEQILTFPILASMLDHPTVIVGISNSFWFDGTAIPRYQASALKSWSRLFHLPLLMAVNS